MQQSCEKAATLRCTLKRSSEQEPGPAGPEGSKRQKQAAAFQPLSESYSAEPMFMPLGSSPASSLASAGSLEVACQQLQHRQVRAHQSSDCLMNFMDAAQGKKQAGLFILSPAIQM